MARPASNQSIEDYLESILVIQQRNGHCRSIDVANRLGYTKASVSVAVANLTRMGYVSRKPDGSLALTERGMAYATSVLDKHMLLCEVLTLIGVPEEIADADACKIEHDISQETFDRIRDWYARRCVQE